MSKPSEAKSKPPSWADVLARERRKYVRTVDGGVWDTWQSHEDTFTHAAEFARQFEAKRSARLLEVLKTLTISEHNQNRLDQVDSDTLQRLLVHMSIVATEALREYRETE